MASRKRSCLVLAVLFLLFLAWFGYMVYSRLPSHDHEAWRRALREMIQSGNDLNAREAAFQRYLDAFPNGYHAEGARGAFQQIRFAGSRGCR